jgi:hypothetical protein
MQTKKYGQKNKFKYHLTQDDLFDRITKRLSSEELGSSVIVPHVCNNIDLFDAGFAAAVSKYYPAVKENYHLLGKNFLKNNFGHSQFIDIPVKNKYNHKLIFVNMIAQNGVRNPTNPRPLNYAALTKCMMGVAHYINQNTDFFSISSSVEIHAPKFGSGLAGGNWLFISDLIEDIWNKYTVYIYDNKK